jgi:hypothetical protein
MAEIPPIKITTPPEPEQEANESQPLLPRHDSGLSDPPKARNPWKIAMYIVLTVVGAVFLGFFIKGFIDADDVDVSEDVKLCGRYLTARCSLTFMKRS